MKSLVVILAAVMMLAISACSDESSKDGEEQVSQPVQNSGIETEADRATESVKDSVEETQKMEDTVKKEKTDTKRDSQ